MSTNITEAWRINPAPSIRELVTLSHEVKHMQEITRFVEIGDRVLLCWCPWYDDVIDVFKNDEDKCAAIVSGALFTILQRHYFTPTLTLPETEESFLREFLERHTKEISIPNKEEFLDSFCEFCSEVYEGYAHSHPSLCFVDAPFDHSVYVKGFGLTAKSVALFDSRYRRFEYTDATEMLESDFPEFANEFANARDNDARDYILRRAQAARGVLWDNALGAHSKWRDAGLSFDLDDMSRTAKMSEIRKTVKYIFQQKRKG